MLNVDTKYAAFLRGINVGGHKIIKMEDLRQIFESFGLLNVATFIQSGNVIFESSRTDADLFEKEVQARLAGSLGYEVEVFLRTIHEVAKIMENSPFQEDEASTAYVTFLHKRPDHKAQETLKTFESKVDEFTVKGREVFCLRHSDKGESIFSNNFLEKTLGMPATTRNMKSIRKIVEKHG